MGDATGSEGAVRHPVVAAELAKRTEDVQLKIADRITAFAGSMAFVYLHAILFTVWMLLLERPPWPDLTLAVSLEAIFLSTFVMIGQNRQASFAQAKADHDFVEQDMELKTNTQLTREIHRMTVLLQQRLAPGPVPEGGSGLQAVNQEVNPPGAPSI
jgi:uncharacterized membrane protein